MNFELLLQALARATEMAAENDRDRNDILRTIAENDRARNELMARFFDVLEKVTDKLNPESK